MPVSGVAVPAFAIVHPRIVDISLGHEYGVAQSETACDWYHPTASSYQRKAAIVDGVAQHLDQSQRRNLTVWLSLAAVGRVACASFPYQTHE